MALVSIACANWAVTNMPGRRIACGLGKRRAQGDRPRALIDDGLGEFDGARVAVIRSVGKLQADFCRVGDDAALRQRAPEREQVGGRFLNIDVDGVQPGDRRQRLRLARSDQRTFGKVRKPNPPADRRRNARETQIDLRRVQRRVVLRHRRLGLPRLGDGVGIILLGDRLLRDQWLVAGRECARRFGLGARACKIGRGLRGLGAIDARVDLVERLPLAGRTSPP